MGTKITELLEGKETSIEKLQGKTFTVDAHNIIYQFLSSIRQRDGSYLTDSKGQVTSHLVGLFNRMTKLMKKNMNFIYCFDGQVPELKHGELKQRRIKKEKAQEKYEKAKAKGDAKAMLKYAQQSSKLTAPMIEEAKKLIEALGQTWVQSPSEGEAQASHMVKKGDAYAVISQDADCFLFGSPRLVKNLTITGRRKKPGKQTYTKINPEILSLSDSLNTLGIEHDQLIALGILVGTDFNPKGIKGIGPKTGLKKVKEHKDHEELFKEVEWEEHFDIDWRDVMDAIKNMEVTDDYEIEFKSPDHDAVIELLVEKHDFDRERVEKTLKDLEKARQFKQKGLGDFIQ